MNLWIIFLTGLTVGGLTCLAVQGGLLASVIAARENDTEPQKGIGKHALYATFAFLLSKLVAFTLLGLILGAFGGMLNIDSKVQTIMQLVAGLYMIAVALNLLNIHPIFRYAIIQPPKVLTRLVKNQSRSKDFFAPALLGAMTIFIPCGTTLAMEALAISSASAIQGALIMFAFVFGTMPLFFGIGVLTSIMGDAFKTKFLRIAAVAVIYLGVSSIYGAFIALGFPFSSSSVVTPVKGNFSSEASQNVEIHVTQSGYAPNYIRVKKGEAVTLTLKTDNVYTCASAFRIPALGISKNLQPNDTQIISFTPTKQGRIPFSCSMGMYTGVIEVV